MMGVHWNIFLYLLLLSIALFYLQRFLQREIQAIFLLLTRQPEISMALFSLLFLPGVLMHELSHFLTAKLLDVPTGRFSIIPRKLQDGRIRLGYVETASVDFVRDALIGAAPMLTGVIMIAYLGVSRLRVNILWDRLVQGQMSSLNPAVMTVVSQPDFWLWFYLVFAISSTMLPSSSDRRAWLPMFLVLAGLLAVMLLAGVGPWLLTTFSASLRSAINAITMVLGVTVLIHLVLLPPAIFMRKVFSRLLKLQVV